MPNPQWDEEHIRDNVVKPQTNESENGPPDSNNLRREIPALHAEETGKTYEPVAADAA